MDQMNTTETSFLQITEHMFDIDARFSYQMTSKGVIRVIKNQLGQKEVYELPSETNTSKNERLKRFLKSYIISNIAFNGIPRFESSTIFNKDEWSDFIEEITNELEFIYNEAIKNKSEIIQIAKRHKLEPKPKEMSTTNWRANCPKGSHTMMISTENNQWGCGYCRKKGTIIDFEEWITNCKSSA